MKSVMGGETTLFIGAHYEINNPGSGQTVTKYYFAGTQRVALRKYVIPSSMAVEYLLGDHLGSTSLTTDKDGNKVSEIRYRAWGEIRSSWTSGAATTPAYKLSSYTFTGQFSYLDDPTTQGTTEGFGLMFYNARWYDPYITQFSQPDSIIPDTYNPQDWNRYAYARNNPLRYTDPSGHLPCASCILSSWIYLILNSKAISNTPAITTPRTASPQSPNDTTAWTVDVLNTNAASTYTQEMSQENAASSVLSPTGLTEATKLFVSLVRPGAVQDYKPDLKGSPALIPGTENVQLGSGQYNYQAIANINFGYVGTAGGFPSNYLQAGAGLFQDENARGPLSTYTDDPFDNYWIKFGVYLYKHYSSDGLTEDEFKQALDEFIEKNGNPGQPLQPNHKR